MYFYLFKEGKLPFFLLPFEVHSYELPGTEVEIAILSLSSS